MSLERNPVKKKGRRIEHARMSVARVPSKIEEKGQTREIAVGISKEKSHDGSGHMLES